MEMVRNGKKIPISCVLLIKCELGTNNNICRKKELTNETNVQDEEKNCLWESNRGQMKVLTHYYKRERDMTGYESKIIGINIFAAENSIVFAIYFILLVF